MAENPSDPSQNARDRARPAQAGPPPVCVVTSRYNDSVTGPMREGAIAAYRDRFGGDGVLGLVDAPGAFELAALASAAIDTGMYEGVVALGCVIKGETEHDRHISGAIANALAMLPVYTGVPVAFGVLTVNTPEQAVARSTGDKGNKGREAMEAVLDTIAASRHLFEAAEAGSPADFALDRIAGDKPGGAGV